MPYIYKIYNLKLRLTIYLYNGIIILTIFKEVIIWSIKRQAAPGGRL